MPGELDDLALALPCPYCHVAADVWCVRRSWSTGEVTGRASWLHEDRKRPLREAWRYGWRDGVDQALHDLDRWAGEARAAELRGVPSTGLAAALRWAHDKLAASWVARRD